MHIMLPLIGYRTVIVRRSVAAFWEVGRHSFGSQTSTLIPETSKFLHTECLPHSRPDSVPSNSTYTLFRDMADANPTPRSSISPEIASLMRNVEEKLVCRPPLLERQFKKVLPEVETCSVPSIRVMQWNVLAQALCKGKDNFVRCPPEAFNFEVRRWQVLAEILRFSPDIVCLQEVDFYDFMEANLSTVGYNGYFYPKRDSPCLYCPDSNGPDGCAIFYKESAVSPLHVSTKILTASGVLTNSVALMIRFRVNDDKPSSSSNTFSMVTTHLKAKAGFEDIRQQQGESLMNFINGCISSRNHPIILCGDFNAEPTEPVYRYISDHQLGLSSVYRVLTDSTDILNFHGPQEPAYTTWKFRGAKKDGKDIEVESCHTLDYIWASKNLIRTINILGMPPDEEVGKGRLPCMRYPSDHFSLVSDLSFPNTYGFS